MDSGGQIVFNALFLGQIVFNALFLGQIVFNAQLLGKIVIRYNFNFSETDYIRYFHRLIQCDNLILNKLTF